MSVQYAKDLLKEAWDAPELWSALGAIRAAWEELDSQYEGERIITEYKEDLLIMYESYAEEDDLSPFEQLTPTQQEAAIDAVVALHENIDEYHAMVDAIRETT